jgi:hypothetical protein
MEQIQQKPIQMSWMQKLDVMIKEAKKEKVNMEAPSPVLNEESTATK